MAALHWKCPKCEKLVSRKYGYCECGYKYEPNRIVNETKIINEKEKVIKVMEKSKNVRYFVNDTIVMNAFTIGYLKMAYLPLSELRIDYDYQRVATKKVDKIANEWDEEKCDPICVSYRNGKFYITDGQHRFLAAVRKGETHLPAIIRTGLSQSEEARIFVSQNDNVSKLTPYDTFKGNILLGDIVDIAINDLAVKYNLSIKNSPKTNLRTIGSLAEARTIVKANGKDCLDWIYKIIRASGWNDVSGAYSTYIIRSLSNAYVNNIDDLEQTGKIVRNIFEKTTPMYFRAEAMLEYVERDPKSACSMFLQKLIRDEYIKKIGGEKITKAELVQYMTENNSKVANG